MWSADRRLVPIMQELNHTWTPDPETVDTVLSLLNDRRRRHAVAVLAADELPADLRELGAVLAARETGTAPEVVPEGTVDALARSLHHVHLPKLDDAGVLDYDDGRNVVTSVRTEALEPLLDLPDGS